MKKLIIFNFGANTEESKLLTHLTELHFANIIGEKNIHGTYPMGRDFNRDDGWNLAEQLSSKDMQSDGNTAHAIVCEYPSRNILEWYETLRKTWGVNRTRLYIRITNTMQIHPLNVSYATKIVNAADLIAESDAYINQMIIPMCMAAMNSFGEYDVELPKHFIIETDSTDEFEEAKKILSFAADKLLIELTFQSRALELTKVEQEES